MTVTDERLAAEVSVAADEVHRLRRIMDSLPAMVSQWDRDLVNVFANAAVADFVGMTPAEIRGRSLGEVFDENLHRLNPADLDAVLAVSNVCPSAGSSTGAV